MVKKQSKSKSLVVKDLADPRAVKKLKSSLGVIIAVFAFILYAQSIGYNYTLDDHPAIDENKLTTKGIAGIPAILATDYWYGYKPEFRGPIYRPTSLIVFAVVWQFFPNNPHIYHFINVLTYTLTCLVLFLVLCKLFKKYNLIFPFVCALLYTAHPIHTEVVNNIKSLDEILCFLFGITSIGFILKYLNGKSIPALIVGSASFYLALISKETGITFVVIIPLIIYFFTDASWKKNLSVSAVLLTLTGIYLVSRMIILKDIHQGTDITASVLNNTLNAAPDFISRLATIFYILLRYVVLLIFPHPLTCDYNFAQIKIQTLSDPAAVPGIILYAGMGIYSLISFRKKSIVAFAILFYMITIAPVSNIFFLNGSTMAERFLFIPSLGFCILLAYLLIKLTKTEKIKSRFRNLAQFISFNSTLFLLVLF
jgi:hypothetical protein